MTVQDCQDVYFELLEEHCSTAAVRAGADFRLLGRQAAVDGFSLSDIVRIHHSALERLAAKFPELSLGDGVSLAANALSELVSGFETGGERRDDSPGFSDHLGDATGRTTGFIVSRLIGVWDWDIPNKSLHIDPNLLEMLGYETHEFANSVEAWLQLVHPEDQQLTWELSRQSIIGKNHAFEFEHRLVHKNGQSLWFLCRGRVIRDSSGWAIRMLGANTNITAARHTAVHLQLGINHYHALLETVPYGIQELNLNGLIVYCNSASDRMLGYRPGERIGRSVFDFFPTQQKTEEFCQFVRRCVDDQPSPDPFIGQQQTANGRIIDVQIDWDYKRNERGELVGFIAVVTDISQRLRAARELQRAHDKLEERVAQRTAALEESESRWRSMVQAAPDYLITVDRDSKITYMNRTPLGAPSERIIGRYVFELADEEFRETLQRLLDDVFETGEFASFETLARGPAEEMHWYNVRYGPIFRDGQVEGVSIFATDIHERKRAEESLHEAHQLLAAVFDNTQLLIAYLDADFNFLSANRAWKKAAEEGICPRFHKGKNYFENSGDMELREALCSVVSAGEPRSEWAQPFDNLLDSTQEATYWNRTLAPVKNREGDVDGIIITLSDVTERVRAVEAIRKSEEHLRAAQRMAKLGSWDWNVETGVSDWSEEMFRIFECDPNDEEPVTDAWMKRIHPDDLQSLRDAFRQAMDHTGTYSIDYRIVLDDGAEKYLHGQSQVKYNRSGKPVMVSGTTQDVTERKLTEEQLRRSESMQRALLNAIPDMIFRVSSSGTFLDFVPAAHDSPFEGLEDIVGKKLNEALPADFAELLAESHRRARETRQLQVIDFRMETDDPPRDIEARSLLGIENNVLTIVRDVSAEKQAQERNRRHQDQLAHVTRLSTMGEMATGIAHELN